MVVVDLDAIRWIESAGNYLRLHTRTGELVTRMKISDIEDRLDPQRFARVHRSAIANLHHVVALRPLSKGTYVVALDNGAEIRMSRSYGRELLSSRFLCLDRMLD